MPANKRVIKPRLPRTTETYKHPEANLPMRPEVGTQAQFKKKKAPRTYRYDSSLSPALEWDGKNPAREAGEALIKEIAECGLRSAELAKESPSPKRDKEVERLKARISECQSRLRRISGPFLNWTGKAERLSFDVPTLPLFVHERLSTKAIIETLKGHKSDKQDDFFRELYGDPHHSVTDQVLRAYEYRDDWVNRMILGDSLVVMNSLLHYESLGGQVQMIYLDPPYGVKFGSNFQPFVRKRDVGHNDDEDMTREPEMVQAYRDTWELGLHSYLTYLRDRLLLARDLLSPSGSIFVQISDQNLHHVRELLDEVFGAENFVSVIPFRKKTMPLGAKHLESVTDYLLWFGKEMDRLKFRNLYEQMSVEGDSHWTYVELADGTRRRMTKEEINNHKLLPVGSTPYQLVSLYPAGLNQTGLFSFTFRGKVYRPPEGNSWFTNEAGMQRLAEAGRIEPYEDGETLRYILKLSDSPITTITNLWGDTSAPSDKMYAVQTSNKVLQRCILMTTDPGDLVLDPTCGSGTTAYVAEQWGRRWITIDTSRVPLALARQRLLTATFPYYELKEDERGPAGGFVYKRKENSRGEEVGGIIPYITKGSIANNEPPAEEVLVDRPEVKNSIVRVTGPFAFEATIPTPVDWEGDGVDDSGALSSEDYGSFVDRMLEVLRKSPLLRLEGNRTVQLRNIRPPAKSLSLSAEAMVDASADGQKPTLAEVVDEAEEKSGRRLALTQKPVAIVFGPENGAVSEKLVYEAAREAHAKNYTQLYVIGFAIQPNARDLIEKCQQVVGVPATYVQATPDLMMGDLLKNMRSSQIFSVCGLPEVKVSKVQSPKSKVSYAPKGETQYQVELMGLDVFDPISMKLDHQKGGDVPAWFLDADYNGLCFHVSQAFFPRTGAWENLKRALKGSYEESVWDHLAGSVSAPFPAGEHGQVAVKVIDQRGNELLVVKSLKEAEE
jgi:adenine-specific DNA-methyltransferase